MNSTRGRAFITTLITGLTFFASLLTLQLGAEQSITSRQLLFVTAGATATWLMTCWTLFFKRKGWSLLWIGFFPSICLIPFALFAYNVLPGFLSGLEIVTFSIIAAGIFSIYTYLLVLTANVLNGAVLYQIPLGQAGKASQFVFSLVSTYLLLVLMFSTNLHPAIRVVIMSGFASFLTLSATWCLQTYAFKQIRLLSVSIGILIGLFTLLISIWPIAGVYGSVVVASVFYMSLNIALEVRELIKNALWIEYSIIVVAIVLALFLLGEWGINGSLL